MNIIHAGQVGQGGPVRIACVNLAKTDLGIPRQAHCYAPEML
jgi:hypothetical protein